MSRGLPALKSREKSDADFTNGQTATKPVATGMGFMLIGFMVPLAFVSCVRIPVAEQQDLSRHNMVFESQGAFASRPSLFRQTEPGSAISSGGQSAGCTACR